MNTLTIKQLADICNTAIELGHGNKPVHISVNWGICPATDNTTLVVEENKEDVVLMIRDEMKV